MSTIWAFDNGEDCMKKLYSSLREIPVVFHDGSNYDYHITIKELANGSEEQFECLDENKEKYKTFPI